MAVVDALMHAGGALETPADLWHHGWLPLGVVVPLVATCALYFGGVRGLRAAAGREGVAPRPRVAAFSAGALALFVALASPLDPLGEVLFSAHMVQHLILVLVAAPLLVLGAPERVALWVFPLSVRKRIGGWGHDLARVLGPLARPVPAVTVATVTLWAWHAPFLYDLAIEHGGLHAIEHASFLATALLFWWTLLRIRTRRADRENGVRLLALFAMAVQGSLLGALITLAATPLYESHRAIGPAWGVEPLVDQQLAGLLMWVPPAALYLGVAAWLFVRLLGSVADEPTARGR